MTALLEVQNLHVDLGEFSLRGADLAVEEGAYCCLIGDSGSGKSVLLETVVGGFHPQRGKVMLRGQDVTNWPPERRNLGIVYQDFMLFPHLNVFENIVFGLRRRKFSRSGMEEEVRTIAARVGIENLLYRDIKTLSGGEQQRTSLARALIVRPQVLLLDEAFSALDVASRERMRYLLRELVKDLHVTVLNVTHDMEDVWTLADQVAVLHDGQILQTGKPEDVFSCPQPGFVAEFLGARNILQGTVLTCDKSGLTHISVGQNGLYSTDPASIDDRVQLSVRPEELAVARKQLPITLRNQIPVRIESLERRGPLVLIIGKAAGFSLEAAVTVAGAQEQNLNIGDNVVFAFSANSLRIISRETKHI
ncbi:ABC transporter ATP-binding protein [Desulfotalea psychrophila]|uniref:Related to ABC transporter, ATP-binding protein n=1 Tax=Desulfotalea psychrophila (strain LSv54 / DSM 12343) TaxID=177439 RepID=Q6ANJ3_DESPS|nr:ATP-binding cassette domain-containing protein [Desulfotalea psychrophila]CAG36081.1 related to ABC transporter, ATP-binding protein [Desulfotalea psychrophila LSv54]